jgi:hypothetical protein
MEADLFDTLTRSLSMVGSRRRVFVTALSGVLAALTQAVPNEVSAARSAKCRREPGECERCDRGTCHKKNGKRRCRPGKIKLGPFGTPCSTGTCQYGACVAAVPRCPRCLHRQPSPFRPFRRRVLEA